MHDAIGPTGYQEHLRGIIFSMGYHYSDKLRLPIVSYSHFTICSDYQNNSLQGNCEIISIVEMYSLMLTNL